MYRKAPLKTVFGLVVWLPAQQAAYKCCCLSPMFGGGLGTGLQRGLSSNQPNQAALNPNNDHMLQSPPTDSISCLAFPPNPNSNVIAAGAWDGTVRPHIFNQTFVACM